jgi:hypothetical protein
MRQIVRHMGVTVNVEACTSPSGPVIHTCGLPEKTR